MEPRTKHKPFAVSIGREEHKRLKILAAEMGSSMSDIMNRQINELWNEHKRLNTKETNHDPKETRQRA